MSEVHGIHEGFFVVLADSCDRCVWYADNIGLLDDTNLQHLAEVATNLKNGSLTHTYLSEADYKASENLRMIARTVFKSGISEEVAR